MGECSANLAFLWASFLKCKNVAAARNQQKTRLEEDPTKVPEMAAAVSSMKSTVFRNHPDTIMPDHRLPRKRFFENVPRDYLELECVLHYELAEVRLLSEKVQMKPSWGATPQQLLRISSEEVPVTPALEDDALNRVCAFWVAMEYGGHCAMTLFHNEDSDKVTGGPLDFLKELEEKRRGLPGLSYILAVDRKIRRSVFRLTTEKAGQFKNMSMALREIWQNERHTWCEAIRSAFVSVER